jgi:putative transposase
VAPVRDENNCGMFPLSPDIKDLVAERSIQVSYDTRRRWGTKFGPRYASRLGKSNDGYGDTGYVDEVFVRIDGKQKKSFRKLVNHRGRTPRYLVTDKLRSYPPAAKDVTLSACEKYRSCTPLKVTV